MFLWRGPVKYESYHSILGLFGVTWQPYVTFTTNNSCWETWISALSGLDLASRAAKSAAFEKRQRGDVEQYCKSNAQLPNHTTVLHNSPKNKL